MITNSLPNALHSVQLKEGLTASFSSTEGSICEWMFEHVWFLPPFRKEVKRTIPILSMSLCYMEERNNAAIFRNVHSIEFKVFCRVPHHCLRTLTTYKDRCTGDRRSKSKSFLNYMLCVDEFREICRKQIFVS